MARGSKREELVVLSAKMSRGLAEQVREMAQRNGQTVSETIGQLLRDALTDGAGDRIAKDLRDEGYQVGRKEGLHDVYVHMKKLFRS